MDHQPRDRLRLNAIALTHALTYAALVAVASTAVSFVLGVASGGGAVRAKIFLFVIGWILMAYAVVRLWPSDPDAYRKKDPSELRNKKVGSATDPTPDSIPAEESHSRFQQTVHQMPPVRWLPRPTPAHRLTTEAKLFLGSVFVLLTSFLMEVVFGVGTA